MNSTPTNSIRLMHLIAGLETGGAQMVMLNLARHLARRGYRQVVVSLTPGGAVGGMLRDAGIPAYHLGMRAGVPNPIGLLRLRKCIGEFRPHILQTWMYHSDLMGGLAAPYSGGPKVVWGIHHGKATQLNWHTTLAFGTSAALSRLLPARIVCCSQFAAEWHLRRGYPAGRTVVVNNGLDLDQWKPDREARTSVRRELEIPDDAELIGALARFDRRKDWPTFFRAAEWLLDRRPFVHFLLAGEEIHTGNAELLRLVPGGAQRRRFHLLGARADAPRLMSALDVFVCSSVNEAFGLAVSEAMATGIPCVSTPTPVLPAESWNDCGVVVSSGRPEELGRGILRVLELDETERVRMGAAARARIAREYPFENMVSGYDAIYRELAGAGHADRLQERAARA